MTAYSPFDLVAAARITRGLVRLIGRPLSVEGAKALMRARLTRRGQLFLEMVQTAIWPYPGSPYRRLLEWAGWTPDRLAESVRMRGLDDTLRALFDDGVYLTFEEFKGRTPIRRDGLVVECTDADFNNMAVQPLYSVTTGGTRSHGHGVPASLDFLAAQRAPARRLTLEAFGAGAWPVVIWVPRDSSIEWWLGLAHMRHRVVRWFSQTDLSTFRVPQLHQMMFGLARFIGLASGWRMPALDHVPLSGVATVLDAVLKARERWGGCAVATSPSAATRLASVAADHRVSLDQVLFITQGEPLTPGKHAEITRTGARVASRYGFTEAGSVSEPCVHPVGVDDTHLLVDCFGLVCDPRTLPDDCTVQALLVTSLLPISPKVLLNVESDDFADVTVRRCGCFWDELGMFTHMSNIRSFSKLTGETVMVLGTDCVRIIEEVLPREFGGRSTDYQLLEAEDENHLTRLSLLVSPSVGPIDERRLLARMIEELRDPTRTRSLMPPLWRQAETIRVVRREPMVTPRGKLLPFHTLAPAVRPGGGPTPVPEGRGVSKDRNLPEVVR